MEERDRAAQMQEREARIRESRFNRMYKEIKVDGIARYLKEIGKEARMTRIARFRMGNELREGRYWEEKEGRRCRECGEEVESWEHVLERCKKRDRSGERRKTIEILREDGGGEE